MKTRKYKYKGFKIITYKMPDGYIAYIFKPREVIAAHKTRLSTLLRHCRQGAEFWINSYTANH